MNKSVVFATASKNKKGPALFTSTDWYANEYLYLSKIFGD